MPNRLKRINSGRNHWYKLDGDYCPGVTTVLGALRQDWMKPWVSGLIANYVADHQAWLAEAPDPQSISTLLKALPNQVRDKAALRGTEVHNLAEQLHVAGHVDIDDDEHHAMVAGYARFLEAWQIEPVGVEVSLCNTKHRWAGTADLIARSAPIARSLNLSADTVGVLDIKTSKGVYGEHAIQVAAYSRADLVHLDGVEQPMPHIDWAALVHVAPNGSTLHRVWPARIDDLYRLFTATLHCWLATDDKRGWLTTAYDHEPLTEPEHDEEAAA